MTLDRRSFLRRSAITLAGGLVLGDEVLEQFARLTHVRKSFPSAGLPITARLQTLHGLSSATFITWSIVYDGARFGPVRV